jgi:hypothetical protein
MELFNFYVLFSLYAVDFNSLCSVINYAVAMVSVTVFY